MNSRTQLATLPVYLLLVLLSACPPAENNPCPDPTNPACEDYNPCDPCNCSQVVYETLSSSALASNSVGEETERKISVYLPECYDPESSKRYPVLYLLHGYMGDHTTWYGGTMSEVYGNTGMYMKKMLDTLINVGYIDPLIVVCPDNFSTYEGSWYTNSTVTGNWEDFMAQEVVSWIDANYRTLAVPESRGIAGHSIGAYGAMKLAMKHPDVFGLVYAMSGTLEFARTYLDLKRDELIAARRTSNWSAFMDISRKIIISRALAYAPNAALSPFQGEFPLDEEGTLIDSTWQKWLAHDLYSMADEYVDKLRSLQGIRFDCGSDDESNISCTHFSDALTRLGIDHHYESYLGNHTDQISERMASKLFPFFSESLEQ